MQFTKFTKFIQLIQLIQFIKFTQQSLWPVSIAELLDHFKSWDYGPFQKMRLWTISKDDFMDYLKSWVLGPFQNLSPTSRLLLRLILMEYLEENRVEFICCLWVELIFVRAGISAGKNFCLRQGAELDSIAVSIIQISNWLIGFRRCYCI